MMIMVCLLYKYKMHQINRNTFGTEYPECILQRNTGAHKNIRLCNPMISVHI